MTVSSERRAKSFLEVSSLYQLGHLPTEWPNSKTSHLSSWAQSDLDKGFQALREVDVEALTKVEAVVDKIDRMRRDISQVLKRGNRVFLCGCGATGRLSLTLEHLWRRAHPGNSQVVSLMAGGDVALVHAIEGFEDYPEYGARHLEELAFSDGDLLVSCTEGGETPYVIGATERATEISQVPAYFLYCNPTDKLIEHVDRSKRVLARDGVEAIELFVGPMALAGSTRMQASTVLQLAVGMALFEGEGTDLRGLLSGFRDYMKGVDYAALRPFTEREAQIYEQGERILYLVEEMAITVFTDTTERAPTFNLWPFESSVGANERTALCYVCIPSAVDAADSWRALLRHDPRPLEWSEINEKTTSEYLNNFDFSQAGRRARTQRLKGLRQYDFVVSGNSDGLTFQLDSLAHTWEWPPSTYGWLYRHLALKMLLNSHSTLLMGRLGRYRNNIMTWVTPTNGKLVDRACRYVMHLLAENRKSGFTYDQVVRELFLQMETMSPSDSLVERTYRALVKD